MRKGRAEGEVAAATGACRHARDEELRATSRHASKRRSWLVQNVHSATVTHQR